MRRPFYNDPAWQTPVVCQVCNLECKPTPRVTALNYPTCRQCEDAEAEAAAIAEEDAKT